MALGSLLQTPSSYAKSPNKGVNGSNSTNHSLPTSGHSNARFDAALKNCALEIPKLSRRSFEIFSFLIASLFMVYTDFHPFTKMLSCLSK